MALTRTRKAAPKADDYKPEVDEDDVADEEGFEDEDEDERAPRSSTVQKGWGAAKKSAKAAKDAAVGGAEFKVEKDKQLVFFTDETGPFAVYDQHWIEREGKKSFICLGKECPICKKLGDKPRGQYAFNIINLSTPEADDSEEIEPTHQAFIAGPMVLEMLSDLDEDETEGPLAGNFYSVSRSGPKGKQVWKISFVKARDLGDDWGIDLAEAKKVIKEKSATLFGDDWLDKRKSTKADLIKIAREND